MNETGKNPFEPKQKGKAAILYLNFLKHATIFALAVSVTFSLKACDKEENPTGRITMTTAASKVGLIIVMEKGADNLTIDWGDGKKSNVNEAILDDISDWLYFTHEYSGTTARNIVITGNVTMLICRGGLTALDVSRSTALTYLNCSHNQLTVLDVSRNTALNKLDCNYNQITSLDMSNNTVLNHISCACNQLTASALNDLFRTLPDYSNTERQGTIYISTRNPGPQDNPGHLDCDRSIAEKKGWVFRTEK